MASERPAADRLLPGKTPEAALRLVPLLYSLCGKAQAAVATAALGAAVRGERVEVDGGAAAREAVAEHLWRLLVDWPEIQSTGDLGLDNAGSANPQRTDRNHSFQKKPDRAAFAGWHRALATGPLPPDRRAALAALAAGPLAESVAVMADRMGAGDAVRPAAPPLFLPPLEAGALAEAFGTAAPEFARHPTWQGRPAETGALARESRPDASLAGRLRARLADLARRVEALDDPTPLVIGVPTGGGGIAGCATARGLLFHRAAIENGTIRSYLVVAPTEWNFHPDSAWVGSLVGLPAETPEIAENALRRWVLALDPCVPATIELAKED